MSYTNRKFNWDFDALNRFYNNYVVKWINSAMSWSDAQTKQARANLGFGNGDIDNVPTESSSNVVKSGGVAEELALGAIYDVSAKNSTAGPNNDGKWESLSALLSDANLNTLIPTSVRKGGMSIKFIQGSVQSSDHKYVQYFLPKDEWSAVAADWEKINLDNEIRQLDQELVNHDITIAEITGGTSANEIPIIIWQDDKFIFYNGEIRSTTNSFISAPIKVQKGVTYTFRATAYINLFAVICTCSVDGSNITPVVQSSATEESTNNYTYTPNVDGYILVSSYKTEYSLSYSYTTTGEIPAIKASITNLDSKILQRTQGEDYYNGYIYPIVLKAGVTYYIKHISGDLRNIYTDVQDAVVLETGQFVAFTPNNEGYPLTYFPDPDTKVAAPVIEVAWSEGVYNEIKSLSDDIEELKRTEIGKGLKKYLGIQRVGFLNNPNLFGADYLFVPVYGQSFTTSYDGGYKITDSYVNNLYMLGSWPTGEGSAVFNPMSTGSYEYFVSDFGDIFSRLLKAYTWKEQKIVAQSFGAGERSVMELSPDNGYGEGWRTYEEIFEPGVHNAVLAAQGENKSIAVPFVLYLQGESDIKTTRDQSATADSWCKGDKTLYKQYMSALKTSMQETIMSETGQAEPPLIIVYTAGNVAFSSRECGIQQAVLELCAENNDMFCVGPYYQLPEMGPHLTPDGRRWQAEIFAKQVFELLVRGEETSVYPEECYVENNNVVIRMKVPTPPLVFDTWTTEERTNKGFFLWEKVSGTIVSSIAISSIAIVEGDTVIITPSVDISGKNVFVTYGSSNCDGGGNLRDSGKWLSHYDYENNSNGGGDWPAVIYIPLDKNGSTLIGKKYPMQMWCPQFGIDIPSSE